MRFRAPRKKVFLLGVGAQKSGTTWLHDYLASAGATDFGAMKEYHVWDRLPGPDDTGAAPVRLARQILHKTRGTPEKDVLRACFRAAPELYAPYFCDLLSNEEIALTGDITPTYARLDTAVLRRIRDDFAARGVAVKVVFLMRDPVYRMRSQVQQTLRRDRPGLPMAERSWTEREERAAIAGFVGCDQDMARADYPGTIRRLDDVFGRDNVFLKLFEEMFQPGLRGELERFLGIELPPAPLDRPANPSTSPHPLPREDYERYRARYRPVIDGVAELTGLDVAGKWVWRAPKG